MKTLKSIYLLLILSFVAIINLQSQEKKKIKIEYSGFLTFDEANYPDAKILTRDDSQQVHIIHEGINMWCDKAIHYGQENFIEAYGNVKMVQGDTINMTSKYIEYSGITKLAFASGDVELRDPNSTITSDTLYFDREKQQAFYRNGGMVVKDTSGTITSKIGRYYMPLKKYKFVEDVVLVNPDATIHSNYFDFYSDTGHAYLFGPSTIVTEESKTYCEKGFYDTKTKIGYAMKNAKIDYDNRIIEGDSLYFDNNKSFASATNNIKVTDTLNNSVAKGHYAELYRAKDSLFITKRALAITVQEKDSIYIHADTLLVTGKPEKRITRAYRNMRLFKSDMSAKADSVHANQATGLTQLINIGRMGTGDQFSAKRKPILWNEENQMTGDTIHLISNTKAEKLDSLVVFNNAFLISKDSLGAGYNQISGQRLIGLFNDKNKLDQVNIIKNAESIFYARNDKGELTAIDKARSGYIEIYFEEGEIVVFKRLNQVDGKAYPLSKFPERDKILKGFDWRDDERPKSIEDLFKDDPPLELPTIKGLDDYVPQEEFFDEELNERIKLAGKSTIVNKAARNVPEQTQQHNNLLKSSNNFDSNDWYKSNVSVKPNTALSPENRNEADNIIGNGDTNSYIYQAIPNLTGDFKFSIWLKGEGGILMILSEKGGNYTNYALKDITLTREWKKYTITCKKEDDGNGISALINETKSTKTLYAWGAELFKTSDN